MNQQSPDLLALAIPFLIVLMSLTVHEVAHAWTADRLGDPTARMAGRISLNPIVHIDLIGTVVLPLVAVFSGLPILGWAKPVPVNISQLRNPRRDFMLVAAAGPASNIVIAALFALAFRSVVSGMVVDSPAVQFVFQTVQINVLLAVFNMIPVPPLDGGNVLAGLLPDRAADIFVQMRPYGFLILYGMMFTGILDNLIVPPWLFIMRLLLQ